MSTTLWNCFIHELAIFVQSIFACNIWTGEDHHIDHYQRIITEAQRQIDSLSITSSADVQVLSTSNSLAWQCSTVRSGTEVVVSMDGDASPFSALSVVAGLDLEGLVFWIRAIAVIVAPQRPKHTDISDSFVDCANIRVQKCSCAQLIWFSQSFSQSLVFLEPRLVFLHWLVQSREKPRLEGGVKKASYNYETQTSDDSDRSIVRLDSKLWHRTFHLEEVRDCLERAFPQQLLVTGLCYFAGVM